VSEEGSIWSHYRKLIALRKSHPVIVYGRYQSYLDQDPRLFVYSRTLEGQMLIVVANFSRQTNSVILPHELQRSGQALVWNYEPVSTIGEQVELKPYEAFAVLCTT